MAFANSTNMSVSQCVFRDDSRSTVVQVFVGNDRQSEQHVEPAVAHQNQIPPAGISPPLPYPSSSSAQHSPVPTPLLRPRPSTQRSTAGSFREQDVQLLPVRDVLPIIESSLQGTNRSCKIYVDRMLSYGYGFPLWLPELDMSLPVAYREIGVQIGDVGYITENGGFAFLFNVWLPRPNTINPSDLPESFYLDNVEPVTSKQHLFDEWHTICSGANVPNNGAARHTRSLFFECYGSEGAVLCTPRTCCLEELRNERALYDFIHRNGEHWYSYAVNHCGRPLRRDSLYFITGHVKTKSWGIATFDHYMPKPHNVLKFGTVNRRLWNGMRFREDSSRSFAWKESRSATARSGPVDSDLPRRGINRDNQCLFLHGFKIALSDRVWASIINGTGVDVGNCPGTSSHTFTNTSSSSGNVESSSSPASSSFCNQQYTCYQTSTSSHIRPRIFHPSDVLNELLFKEQPTARMAIAHDKDWMALIHEKGVSYGVPLSTVFTKTLLQRVKYVMNDHYIMTYNGEGLSAIDICPPPNCSDVSVGEAFSRYGRAGITSVQDLGEMEGIVELSQECSSPCTISKFWKQRRIKHLNAGVEWVEPFVKLLQKWERNDKFEIGNWIFKAEKQPQLPKLEEEPWNVFHRAWLDVVGCRTVDELTATSEYWASKLSGKFTVNRETRVPQEPVKIRRTSGPSVTEYNIRGGSGFTISKYPNAVAFSIGRTCDTDENSTRSSPSDCSSDVLLACQEVQEMYTDLIPTGHDLITHGLLDGMSSKESIRTTPQYHPEKRASDPIPPGDSLSDKISSKKFAPTIPQYYSEKRISQDRSSLPTLDSDISTIDSSPGSLRSFTESDSVPLPKASDATSRKFRSHKEAFSPYKTTSFIEAPHRLYSPIWPVFSQSQETFSETSHPYQYQKRNKSTPRLLGTSWYRSTTENEVFADIPFDSPYMILPLWPGRTDSFCSKKYPFKVPFIPYSQRLYLLIWYRPDPNPNTFSSSDSWSESSSTNSDLSVSAHVSFSRRSRWSLSLRRFRFTARVLTYDQLQGSGVRIPENGLDVCGPLKDAFMCMPTSPTNVYGGTLLGQYLGKGEGFMFNADALEQLQLCQHTYERTDDEFQWAEGYDLTPVGRAVVEMAWVGGMAFTGSEHD